MSDNVRDVLRRYAFMIYAPTALFSFGEGAVLPLLPILAAERGAADWLAALVAGCLVMGQLVGNLPGGWLAARVGERITMIIGGCLAAVASAGIAFLPGVLWLAISTFVLGIAAAGFGLARHAFMTTRVPFEFRARALALVGGTFRFGMFAGPFAGAGLVLLTGDGHAGAWLMGICMVAVTLLVALGPDPETKVAPMPASSRVDPATAAASDTGEAVTGAISLPRGPQRVGLFETIWQHRGVLARLGVAAGALSAVRGARLIVLPLVGVAIGLDAAAIAMLVGISGGIEFALFYASGQVMDRFGRLWSALPPMIIMGIAFLALAVTQVLDGAQLWYAALAVVLGVGNGVSSGVLMTLGADTAPQDRAAQYLGAWRTITDAGGASVPLIVSGVTAAFGLAVATGAIGVIGLAGAVGFLLWLPRYITNARR